MEKEVASKIFMIKDYNDKENMEVHIKEYIKRLREEYPFSVITREFYKGSNILVRATQILSNVTSKKIDKEKQEELEKEEVRIKERGINGLGENVYIERSNGRSRGLGHNGGNERERGGR